MTNFTKTLKIFVLLGFVALSAGSLFASEDAIVVGDCPGSGQMCKITADAIYVKGLDQ